MSSQRYLQGSAAHPRLFTELQHDLQGSNVIPTLFTGLQHDLQGSWRQRCRLSVLASAGVGSVLSSGAVCCGSFCCSGQHQETRQAKDHPKAAYEAWHTAWRYPFRARRDWQSQAHLHTTLNKSRDEKLEIVGVWPTYPFGKRACIMGEGPNPAACVGNRTRSCAGSRGGGDPAGC